MPDYIEVTSRTVDPQWAIIIPTFKRYERFFTCLRCLLSAIAYSGQEAQILIMDNSPTSRLLNSLKRLAQQPARASIVYTHLPSLNQSELRNEAFRYVSQSVTKILIMDSDIYLSKTTLKRLNAAFEEDSKLVGVAPPLAHYRGGKHDQTRTSAAKALKGLGDDLVMPSAHDFAEGTINRGILYTLMLRGVFALKRTVVRETFGSEPWLPVFKLWQNVPFFISLREMRKKFGYLLDPSATALHDERPHTDTLRSSETQWHSQTLKSLILVFFRNQLWRTEQVVLNQAFLRRITPVLGQHSSLLPCQTFSHMVKAAESLSDEKKAKSKLLELSQNISDPNLKEAVLLLWSEPWSNIRAVKSYNLKMPI